MSLSRTLAGAAIAALLVGVAGAQAPGPGPRAGAPRVEAAAPPLPGLRSEVGALPDGTAFRMDVPVNWNGALLLDLDYAGRPNPAASPNSRMLLERGYAIAGTTRTITGWAVPRSVDNLVEVETRFEAAFGRPKWPIAYGGSLGGHTVFVAVYLKPDRFVAGVGLCGSPAGAIGLWNGKLDALFVAKTLIAPESDLAIIDVPADFEKTALPAWKDTLAKAQQTPEGRARIALAASLAQLPEWSVNAKPKPAATDIEGRQVGLYDSFAGGPQPVISQVLSSRRQINGLAGGNISWNNGVDYTAALNKLPAKALVEELYRRAGLSLSADLDKLAKAPRIAADPQALRYMAPQQYDGDLRIPVLGIHPIGDQIGSVSAAQSFDAAVGAAGRTALLRQVYTDTAGHCAFSAAETVAAVETMKVRLETGKWPETTAAAMNARARGVVADGQARFVDFKPTPYLRAVTARELAKLVGEPATAQ